MPAHRAPWIALLCLLVAATSFAQALPGLEQETLEWDVDGLERLVPRQETAAEREFVRRHPELFDSRDSREDPPPVGPIRNCAEWEPCQGVLIRYPLGLPYSLLRDLDDDVILYVVVASGSLASAQSSFSANGVDLDRVEWVVRNNDTIWTRDYGPWFVFDGNGDIGIIDHTYNRPWRVNDNLIPVYVAQQLGIPSYSHDMWHTGGNYMTDGAHISSSTQLVYNEAAAENGMSPVEVDQLMNDYYGIESYQVLPYIESGGIHHIDTWAKFLDEETVLVKDVWTSHWTYDELNQRATLLGSLEASTGRNYQVHRVYCYNIGGSSPASYTNSLILNDNIYVPTFGNAIYDEQALDVYREAAPGYTVRGYYYGGFISDDALHCRTKGIMDVGMLRVAHVPVREEQPLAPVVIAAEIVAHGGSAIIDARVVYRHGGGDWQDATLVPTGADGQHEAHDPCSAQRRGLRVLHHRQRCQRPHRGIPSGRTGAYDRVCARRGRDHGRRDAAGGRPEPQLPQPLQSVDHLLLRAAPSRPRPPRRDRCARPSGSYAAGSRVRGWHDRGRLGRHRRGRPPRALGDLPQPGPQAAGLQYTKPATLVK